MSPDASPSGEGKATGFLHPLVVGEAGAGQPGGTLSPTGRPRPPGFTRPVEAAATGRTDLPGPPPA